MNVAVLQDPDTLATSLTTEVTTENFSRIVYRPSVAGAAIAEEDGRYVENQPDGSRRVLFNVRT